MAKKDPARIYGVAQINGVMRRSIERWGEVWIEGELSDVSRAASGHVYFTLNDGARPAQLPAVMYRSDAQLAKARVENGARVRALGRFSLYEPRGRLQLVARTLVDAGDGGLAERREKLKRKLQAEGLFAQARKRPLPRYPRTVGVVTSLRGAALHDVVRVASRRAPVRLIVSHCTVQGPDAPASIVAALRRLRRFAGLDAIILTRGGGASEDLAAFDEEIVVREVARAEVPVIAGVGHEVDVSLADLVADARAATPSHAVELLVPDREALVADLHARQRQLEQALSMKVGRDRLQLERLRRRLADPRRAIGPRRQALEAQRVQLVRAQRSVHAAERSRLEALLARLRVFEPRAGLARDRARLDALVARLTAAARGAFEPRRRALTALADRSAVAARGCAAARRRRHVELSAQLARSVPPSLRAARGDLRELAARLDALSPLKVLGRGYAIALSERTGKALRSPADAPAGERFTLRLARGAVRAEVLAEPPEPGAETGEPRDA